MVTKANRLGRKKWKCHQPVGKREGVPDTKCSRLNCATVSKFEKNEW